MATKLVEITPDGTRIVRAVTRVVTQVPQRGAIVVTLSEDGIVFRSHKKRTRFTLPYGLGMLRAEQLAAIARMHAKKEAKAAGLTKRTRRRTLTRGR